MNFKKIDILLGMKDIQRLPNTPHHRGYNLLEHGLVVGMLFRWFASEEDVAYDINVFDKVLLHDYVESVSNFANVFICVVITCFAIHAMMKSRHGRAVLL